MRHIIEPAVSVGLITSNIDPGMVPVLDQWVEHHNEGLFAQAGLTQTWQTRRGPADAPHVADVLRLHNEIVLWKDQEGRTAAPISRFYAWQPEASIGGDHFYSDARWALTEHLSLNGDARWALDDNGLGDKRFKPDLTEWSAGMAFQHTRRLHWHVGYRELVPIDERLLRWGVEYEISPRHAIGFEQRIDLSGESRYNQVNFERRLPDWIITVRASVDGVDGSTGIGLFLTPRNARGTHMF